MLNRQTRETYNYVDDDGMMTPEGRKEDSILLTFEAWYAYRDPSFLGSIRRCFIISGDEVMGFRHPSHNRANISRDHAIAAVLAFYVAGELAIVRGLARGLRGKLSDGHRVTLDMRIWLLVLIGYPSWIWYTISIPFMFLAMTWNKLIQVLGSFYEVPNMEYVYQPASRYKRILRYLRYPSYAHYIASWQNYVLPDSLGKRIMSRILRMDTGRYNPATRLLNGLKWNGFYAPFRAGRLSTRTDKTNDRPMLGPIEPGPHREFNAVDYELVEVLKSEKIS